MKTAALRTSFFNLHVFFVSFISPAEKTGYRSYRMPARFLVSHNSLPRFPEPPRRRSCVPGRRVKQEDLRFLSTSA